MEEKLQFVATSREYDSVTLIDPTDSGFVLIAAEVDKGLPLLPFSPAKSSLIRDLKILCQAFERTRQVRNAKVFRSLLIPPGRSDFLKRRPRVHVAKFDVVVLIETASVSAAETLRLGKAFAAMRERIEGAASYANLTFADNARRIGPVQYDYDGVFLFNYFYSDDLEQNLAVWEYTAAWFQEETGLDNSVLLRPLNEKQSDYTLINHCRWGRLSDILSHVVLKPTYRSFVVKNFDANHIAAMPVLYRLA